MALIQLDFTSETVKVCLPLYMIVPTLNPEQPVAARTQGPLFIARPER